MYALYAACMSITHRHTIMSLKQAYIYNMLVIT